MDGCIVCGDEGLTRSCNYCGETVCTSHRLPESHQCAMDQQPDSGSITTTNSNRSSLIPSSNSLKWVAIIGFGLFIFGVVAADTDTGGPADTEFNAEIVEDVAFERINKARQKNGLSRLKHDESVETRAERWSQTMADTGRFEHATPKCRVGGENIAFSYFRQEINTDRGDRYFESNREMGIGLANQWLNSTEHRETIMQSSYTTSGIGVVIVDDPGNRKVYATQRFCG